MLHHILPQKCSLTTSTMNIHFNNPFNINLEMNSTLSDKFTLILHK